MTRAVFHSRRGRAIGTPDGARRALYAELECISRDGLFKVCYRDGATVYKVPRYGDDCPEVRAQASAEFEYARQYSAIVAPTSVYIIDGLAVIAQPYLPYSGPLDGSNAMYHAGRAVGMQDLHDGNIRNDGVREWITDPAGYGDTSGSERVPVVTRDVIENATLDLSHLGPRDEDDDENDYGACNEGECDHTDCHADCATGDCDYKPKPVTMWHRMADCATGLHLNAHGLTARMAQHVMPQDKGACQHIDPAYHPTPEPVAATRGGAHGTMPLWESL